MFLATVLSVVLLLDKLSLHIVGTQLHSLLYLVVAVFVFVYIGLVWAFDFNVKKSSLLVLIPQSASFVALQAMFIEVFFFRRNFRRLYELLLFVMLFSFIFASTYVAFLMTNIFNVEQYRDLPLRQVARTVSYAFTVLAAYYITYTLLLLGINVWWTVSILFLVYLFFNITHHYSKGRSLDTNADILVYMSMAQVLATFAMMIWGGRYELSAVVSAAVAFAVHGVLMHKEEDIFNKGVLIAYGVVIALGFALSVLIRVL